MAQYPKFSAVNVLIPRFELTLQPWDEWKKADGVPFWWTAYNKIKHERATEFQRANLQNALNAIAALFVALLHLHQSKAELGELIPNPVMLRPHDTNFQGISYTGYEPGFTYVLS